MGPEPLALGLEPHQELGLTLQNSGVVEHDVTIPSAGFSLLARAGQTVTGDFTFDKPGVFDFFCSIPGHKDAGMKGTLTVLDPLAPAMPAPQAASSTAHDTGFAVLHGLYWLRVNLADHAPLLLAVDDAHWADEASLRWLAYRAPRLDGPNVSLIAALRPDEPASAGKGVQRADVRR